MERIKSSAGHGRKKKHETKLASYLGALGADHDIAHHG